MRENSNAWFFATIFCAAVLVSYIFGRSTAPRPDNNQKKIDSLFTDIKRRVVLEAYYKEQSDSVNRLAEQLLSEQQELIKHKVITRTVYVNDTIHISHYSPSQLDSFFLARYGRP